MPDDAEYALNPLGWPTTINLDVPDGGSAMIEGIPPFGHAPIDPSTAAYRLLDRAVVETRDGRIRLRRGGCEVEVDSGSGSVFALRACGVDISLAGRPLIDLQPGDEGAIAGACAVTIEHGPNGEPEVVVSRWLGGVETVVRYSVLGGEDGVRLDVTAEGLRTLAPGFSGALRLWFNVESGTDSVLADTPWSVERLTPRLTACRKYPRGDWMTSEQWFEEVRKPFVAQRFLEVSLGEGELLVVTNSMHQGFMRDGSVELVLAARDPWDEARVEDAVEKSFLLLPHKGMTNAQRVQRAEEFLQWPHLGSSDGEPGDIPASWGSLSVEGASNVLAHAFYRESMRSGEHLPDWAGHRIARESGGACTHPFVIRLVEWDGEPAEVTLKLPGTVALAAKTNLMGECGSWQAGAAPADAPLHLRDTGWLAPGPSDPPEWARGAVFRGRPIEWSFVRFAVRPREIVTVMADLVMGRKEWRDLDAKREVWATVHRTPGQRDNEGARP
ncbi:MAG: hypothetical protein KIS87_10620 [Phycisphaeraceae bacterium]|nr:hypothetical protein [Phycisphaeraceae bacterium]